MIGICKSLATFKSLLYIRRDPFSFPEWFVQSACLCHSSLTAYHQGGSDTSTSTKSFHVDTVYDVIGLCYSLAGLLTEQLASQPAYCIKKVLVCSIAELPWMARPLSACLYYSSLSACHNILSDDTAEKEAWLKICYMDVALLQAHLLSRILVRQQEQ